MTESITLARNRMQGDGNVAVQSVHQDSALSFPSTLHGEMLDDADITIGTHSAEHHLKCRSSLHQPYGGIKLAWPLESARLIAYERREDGCFWYTICVTPCPRLMPPRPQK